MTDACRAQNSKDMHACMPNLGERISACMNPGVCVCMLFYVRTKAGATEAAWTGAFLMSLGVKEEEEDGAGVPRLAEMVEERARGATVVAKHQLAAAVDIIVRMSRAWCGLLYTRAIERNI